MDYLIILNFLTAIVALVVLCRKRHFLFALVALFCTILYGRGGPLRPYRHLQWGEMGVGLQA